MARRKFYYNDIVRIRSGIYSTHMNHLGKILSSRIARADWINGTRVSYKVACECGGNIMPLANHMELAAVSQETSLMDMRKNHFRRLIGREDFDIDEMVGNLGISDRDSRVVVRALGLDGDESLDGQQIADSEGITKQRVNQILRKAIIKLQKEKHED